MEYTEETIEVLSDRNHVLARPEMYVGNTGWENRTTHLYDEDGNIHFATLQLVPALEKIVEEVIANGVDEHIKGRATYIDVKLQSDNQAITIRDNGAGIPMGKHPEAGIPTPEVVLTQLRSGSNFGDDRRRTLGLYGVGVSLTTFLSEHLRVRIRRDNKEYEQHFRNNGQEKTEPVITDAGDGSFTEIEFTPDFSRFACDEFDPALIRKTLFDFSYMFPKLWFSFKPGYGEDKEKIKCSGIDSFMEQLIGDEGWVTTEVDDVKVGIGVCPDKAPTRQISFVNGARTWRGGIHIDYMVQELKTALRERFADETKLDIKPRDISNNLFLVVFLNIDNPTFEGQAKERLVNGEDELAPYLDPILTDKRFLNKIVRDEVIRDAIVEAAEDRIQRIKRRKLKKKEKTKTRKRVAKLVPATTRDASKAELYVVEGLSAMQTGTSVRDPETMAIYPLKGKVLNAYKNTDSRVLSNAELSDMISVLGLSILDDSIDTINYRKIFILSDSDEDGAHIRSLLLTFFYTYWPDLFEERRIAILQSPRYVLELSTGDKRYFYSKQELEDYYTSQPNARRNARYIKGLGSLERDDWQYMLHDERRAVDVVLGANPDRILEIAFGDKKEERKQWLMEAINAQEE